MGCELRLRLLGKPLLARSGIPLAGLTLRKSVALLAYLAVTGRAHDRGALAGLLGYDRYRRRRKAVEAT